jgi:hypothetical protein
VSVKSTSVLDLDIAIVNVLTVLCVSGLHHPSGSFLHPQGLDALSRLALHLHLDILLAELEFLVLSFLLIEILDRGHQITT